MKIEQILKNILDIPENLKDLEIEDIEIDSRKVSKNSLFIAIGAGNKFIKEAKEKGAIAVLSDEDYPNIKEILPQILDNFWGDSQPENIIAVTGTNGKSSVVHFMREIWKNLGYKAASIGTIGIIADGKKLDSNLTTPDPASLRKTLKFLKEQGITHLAIEASSHGLEQGRINGIKIKAAAFTNFTQDHLDYHQTMGKYFAAKTRLFSEILPPSSSAILNADIDEYSKLVEICEQKKHQIISFGKNSNDLKLVDIKQTKVGESFNIKYDDKEYSLEISLFGYFQIYNILCSIALNLSMGEKIDKLIPTLKKLSVPEGRMDLVRKIDNIKIFIDYAHTPDALENALQALKNKSRLILVFGCGGNRDQEKRSIMGKIAHDNADIVIITDDNPRNEDPAQIRQEIIKNCEGAIEIGDRKSAIEYAAKQAKGDDIVLIAGKGHEKYQIIRDKMVDFDDREIVNLL